MKVRKESSVAQQSRVGENRPDSGLRNCVRRSSPWSSAGKDDGCWKMFEAGVPPSGRKACSCTVRLSSESEFGYTQYG
jgi:hypothetical protein